MSDIINQRRSTVVSCVLIIIKDILELETANIIEELFELLVVGGTDGTERVTHENTGGKQARSKKIFLGS